MLEIQWCPLFKSASSPWMAVFTKLSGALTFKTEAKIRKGQATFLNLAKDFRLFVPEGAKHTANDKNIPRYTMVVVRHPFKRILSAFRDKLERTKGREFYNKKYSQTIIQRFRREKSRKARFDFMELSKDVKPSIMMNDDNHSQFPPSAFANGFPRIQRREIRQAPTFLEFCEYLLTVDPKRMDEHWRPQYLDCSPCHHNFDLILKVEDIDRDKLQVFQLLGQANFTISENKELENTWNSWTNRTPTDLKRNEYFYFSQLPLSLLKNLYEIYEPDFKLFGYSPDEYFDMAKSV